MVQCKPIKIDHRGVCAGSMDRRITISDRTLDAPTDDIDYGHSFDNSKTVWAGLKTKQGRQSFYTTNTEETVTHVFYVRWFNTITANKWVSYQSETYNIVEVENIDERSEFAALYCNVRGSDSEAVNLA